MNHARNLVNCRVQDIAHGAVDGVQKFHVVGVVHQNAAPADSMDSIVDAVAVDALTFHLPLRFFSAASHRRSLLECLSWLT